MSQKVSDKVQFRIEFFLALLITGLACVAGFSNLLFASNELYPGAYDFTGHMAKIQYITECIQNGTIPSWYPYWYNGTAVNQYYPPFSYYFTVPIFALTKNVMLTFKMFCFIMLFIGGMGVWNFCRLYIGKWCGFFGVIAFCWQPFILQTLLDEGQIAQGPVIALTPWYLIMILEYCHKPSAKKFMGCSIICSIMILSHANTIFMLCICIMFALVLFLPLKIISFQTYCHIGLTIIFAGILTAFWSLVGVTGLENPGVPNILSEVVTLNTASLNWFIDPDSNFYFAIPISIGCVSSVLLFAYLLSINRIRIKEDFFILFCILLSGISVILSFGYHIPFFTYLPMAESFMAGRILNLTAVPAAILCAYLIFGIKNLSYGKGIFLKILASSVSFALILPIVFFINPYQTSFSYRSIDNFREMISNVKQNDTHFERGRYTFIGAFDSSQTYYPILCGFNNSEGFNVEGTVHSTTFRNQIIANASENYDYIAKNLAYWNVRYLLLNSNFDIVIKGFNDDYDFQRSSTLEGANFYVSSNTSSYFFVDKRNSLILGKGSPSVGIEFPYLVQGRSDRLNDYSMKELEKYKLVYLCEPTIDTIREKNSIEEIVEKLVDEGITVIIEPEINKGLSLFDVVVSDFALEESPAMIKQKGSKINSSIENINVDTNMSYGRALFGVEKVYYSLVQNNGSLENAVIGTKRVGKGEVLFLGKHLSQYLKAVYLRNWGAPADKAGYPECSDEVKSLFEDIFETYGVNKDFWPDAFPIQNAKWNNKGVNFDYSAKKSQEITISVTYAPRWKATLDGKRIEVGQKENLITINLPAGKHHVKLVYGLTKYGIAGYIISVVGLLIFILFIKFYDIIVDIFRQICVKLCNFLQLGNND